jgi:hypothetical protein
MSVFLIVENDLPGFLINRSLSYQSLCRVEKTPALSIEENHALSVASTSSATDPLPEHLS